MADNETTTMNLSNDVTVNGIKYSQGQRVVVPKSQADDIARIDYDHNQYKDNLHKKQVYEVNAGSIAVGS